MLPRRPVTALYIFISKEGRKRKLSARVSKLSCVSSELVWGSGCFSIGFASQRCYEEKIIPVCPCVLCYWAWLQDLEMKILCLANVYILAHIPVWAKSDTDELNACSAVIAYYFLYWILLFCSKQYRWKHRYSNADGGRRDCVILWWLYSFCCITMQGKNFL